MSVRSDILSNIETVLKGITGVGDVFVGKYTEVDLASLKFPALFVLQGGDQESVDQTFSSESFKWDIIIEAWCQDINAEVMFSEIHTAMRVDERRGGYAISCRRTGSQILSLDPARGLIAMQQTHEIHYEHPIGQP
jgi:hypothetical protein